MGLDPTRMALLGALLLWAAPWSFHAVHVWRGVVLALLLTLGVLFSLTGLAFLLLALFRTGFQVRIVAIAVSAFFLSTILASLALSNSDAFIASSVGIFASILVAAAADAKVFTSGSDE